jgi:hypothetical protein
MDTSSLAISQPQPPNPSNVLFEPQIYRAPIEEDKNMEEDNVSVSTHAGANVSIVSNYKSDLDPALFAANKM